MLLPEWSTVIQEGVCVCQWGVTDTQQMPAGKGKGSGLKIRPRKCRNSRGSCQMGTHNMCSHFLMYLLCIC